MSKPALSDPNEQQDVRPLDPNVSQRRASDPAHSVWVGASAGTGKTKVLTDRVLRLLLPRADGQPGTAPHRILCLTFTRAAASEMLQRVNRILGLWAVADDETLTAALQDLTGTMPTKAQMQAARQLFAAVVDVPGGLKIMTIHAFCQSILVRFPLEAGVPPHATVIDEAAAGALLLKARDDSLAKARREPDSPLGTALRRLAAVQNEDQFNRLLGGLCSERRQLQKSAARPNELYERLCGFFGLSPVEDEETMIGAACRDEAFDKDGLARAAAALAGGSKTDQARGADLQLWLAHHPAERAVRFEAYSALFLTTKGEPRARLATKSVLSADPSIEDTLGTEAARLAALAEFLKARRCAVLTRDLITAGQAMAARYQHLKDAQAALDYDDLIDATLSLFDNSAMAAWVLYKLDGGLDHILVDEAQDTNPEQWQIITHLCEEFFSGHGARDDTVRTLFAVGDEKQSIYSFQRAAPQEFDRMRRHFAATAQAREETLDISFRSVPSVLRLVDEVFRPDGIRAGLGAQPVSHRSFRRGQAGLAELWPLCTPDESAAEPPWTPPTKPVETPSGAAKLAAQIATQIRDWLDDGELIPSLARPIQPGDILILVRTRTAFVTQLVRALKTRNIPVSGVDRMVLGEQIAVMDLCALAQAALLPADDLSLACVLKSPLVGLDEEQLFALAHNRTGSLWQALQDDPAYSPVAGWLETLISATAQTGPYAFFAQILQSPCPADPVSGLRAMRARLGEDALDPLDEFLNAALDYERSHIPSVQGFLLWQRQGDLTIKRELEEAGQAVRIMTVHGAKGLQAPVVIMPDTTRTAASRRLDTLLWPDKTGLDFPLWAPRSEDFPLLYKRARAQLDKRMEEEYRRLLYVALTRAEDRLYICGYQGKKPPVEECWYHYVAAAFARLDEASTLPDSRIRLSSPQIRAPDRAAPADDRDHGDAVPLPGWLYAPAPAEPDPPRPLMPSRPAMTAPAVRSPLDQGADGHRFQRGLVTHSLLQYLPGLPPDKRHKAAAGYVSRTAPDLPAALQDEIVSETMAILDHPDYAAFFGPGALAEVPVTGLVNGLAVSARIDRLLVTADTVSLVDYKTNRPPPQNEAAIPGAYRAQMKAYRDIVAAIYPDHAIACYLLWTDGPRLMKLSGL